MTPLLDDDTVILWDVMSTLVYDPYLIELPAFFSKSWEELLQLKHPTAWVEFELGELSEARFFEIFCPELGPIDADAFHQMLRRAYRFLPGIEALLLELKGQGVAMYALSNYPVWYRLIERKLKLSRFLSWRFVSCHMGTRKPDEAVYLRAAEALGLPPQRCLFIDDRDVNCEAALSAGMKAIRYRGTGELRGALCLA